VIVAAVVVPAVPHADERRVPMPPDAGGCYISSLSSEGPGE
jgi:hypothetical protein